MPLQEMESHHLVPPPAGSSIPRSMLYTHKDTCTTIGAAFSVILAIASYPTVREQEYFLLWGGYSGPCLDHNRCATPLA